MILPGKDEHRDRTAERAWHEARSILKDRDVDLANMRQRAERAEAMSDEALGLLVRAKADVYMRWCKPSECAIARDTDAFLDRDDVKKRLAAQEGGTR